MDIKFTANKKKWYIEIPVYTIGVQTLRVLVTPHLLESGESSKPFANFIDKRIRIDTPRALVPKNSAGSPNESLYDTQGVIIMKLPRTTEKLNIKIFNEAVGDLKIGDDKSFKLSGVDYDKKTDQFIARKPIYKPLTQHLEIIKANYNHGLLMFLDFIEEFSENCGMVSASSSIYRSADGVFKISYVSQILTPSGAVVGTPSRIYTGEGNDKGLIELNKSKIIRYSIPCRIALLLHEYFHVYRDKTKSLMKEYSYIFHNDLLTRLNVNDIEEMEADLNAIIVFLCLNYPTADAKKWFLNFAPEFVSSREDGSDQIMKRNYVIERFIDAFSSKYNLQ